MTRLRYETKGGNVSEGETFAQLTEYLRLAEECMYTLGHLAKANDDRNLGDSWIKAGEKLSVVRKTVTDWATGKITIQRH